MITITEKSQLARRGQKRANKTFSRTCRSSQVFSTRKWRATMVAINDFCEKRADWRDWFELIVIVTTTTKEHRRYLHQPNLRITESEEINRQLLQVDIPHPTTCNHRRITKDEHVHTVGFSLPIVFDLLVLARRKQREPAIQDQNAICIKAKEKGIHTAGILHIPQGIRWRMRWNGIHCLRSRGRIGRPCGTIGYCPGSRSPSYHATLDEPTGTTIFVPPRVVPGCYGNTANEGQGWRCRSQASGHWQITRPGLGQGTILATRWRQTWSYSQEIKQSSHRYITGRQCNGSIRIDQGIFLDSRTARGQEGDGGAHGQGV